jgi:hypothetical protein
MNLATSILTMRFAQWSGETGNLMNGYFCCTLVSGRLEEHFSPQIWCTPTTSPSILCVISPVYSLRSSLTTPWTSLDPVFAHLYWPWRKTAFRTRRIQSHTSIWKIWTFVSHGSSTTLRQGKGQCTVMCFRATGLVWFVLLDSRDLYISSSDSIPFSVTWTNNTTYPRTYRRRLLLLTVTTSQRKFA